LVDGKAAEGTVDPTTSAKREANAILIGVPSIVRLRREAVVRSLLERITGRPFFNLSRLDFAKLLERSEPARRQSQRVRSTR